MIQILEWGGTVTVIIGALLVAHQGRWMAHGFVLMLVSNVFWARYGMETNAVGIVITQMVFAVINLFGLYRRAKGHKPAAPPCATNAVERLLCPWRSS